MKNLMHTIFGKCTSVLAAIFLPLFLSFPCFAAGEISLQLDDSDLMAGDEITVSANLSENSDIYALTGTLQYDSTVFEALTTTDFVVPETMNVSYNAENRKFGIINQTGNVGSRLFSVRLRVREDASVGETNIAFSNIEVSDGSNKTTYSTATVQALVTRDAADDETISTHSENAIVETIEEAQSAFTTIPFIVAGAIIVAMIVLVAIMQFGNLTPNTSKLYYHMIMLGAVTAVLTIALAVVNNSKKDVNGDSAVDYKDAQEIIDYLISAEGSGQASENADESTDANGVAGESSASSGASNGNAGSNGGDSSESQRRPEDFDVNNDGKVDVNDAGHQAEHVQKETKVTLSDSDQQESYVEKHHAALIFAAKIEPADITITRAMVNGQYYDVEPHGGDFVAHIEPMTEAKIYDFVISEVQTSNGRTIKLNYERSIEVLKSKPMVENFQHDAIEKTVSFSVHDPDNTLKSAQADLYESSNLESALQTISVNLHETTTLQYSFSPETSYTIEVSGEYCRTQDTNNQDYCETIAFYTHEFSLNENFGFSLDEYSLSDYVTPEATPLMNFRSSNSKNLAVQSVRVHVDDNTAEEYAVVLGEDGRYEVVLDNAEKSSGTHHYVTLEQVTLEDGSSFQNPEDFLVNDLTYFVPNDLPAVHNLTVTNNAGAQRINVRFDLADKHSAVRKLTYLLVDAGERVVARYDATDDFVNIAKNGIDLDYGTNARDLAFTVKILADYDLGEKYTFTEQELAEKYVSAYKNDQQLYIKQISSRDLNQKDGPETRYAEKGQKKFQILLELYREKDLVLKGSCTGNYGSNSAFTVNGLNYTSYGPGNPWQNTRGFNSAVYIGIPEEAGVVNLAVTRVQYMTNGYNIQCSDWFTVPKKEYQIEVLRDKPQIQNLIMTEDYDAGEVTFDFDVMVDASAKDGDESFKSGTIQLGDTVKTIESRGHNSITFSGDEVTEDKVADLIFKANYDRDTDALNAQDDNQDKNEFENDIIYQTKYGLFSEEDYADVKIAKAEALTERVDNLFEKNETIGLYFEIDGIPERLSSEVPPVKIRLEGRDELFDLEEIAGDDGELIANNYAAFIPGYTEAGNYSAKITEIVLYNGQVIKVADEHSPAMSYEVLKDTPTIVNFEYKINGDQIEVKSRLLDDDEARSKMPRVKIVSEDGTQVYSEEYSEKFTFDKTDATRYCVTVTADYNRAHGTETEKQKAYLHQNATLLSTIISTESNVIELKDISDISLYHVDSKGNSILTDEVSATDINGDNTNYYVKISMEGLPALYVKVTGAEEDDGKLYLLLDAEYLATADDYQGAKSRVEFGAIDEHGKAHNESKSVVAFQRLIEQLNSTDTEVTLTRDYDAADYPVPESGYYVANFDNRELNGNGYTIRNLHGALFGNVSNSEIKNLTLENINISDAKISRGALASRIDNKTEVEQVAAYDVYMNGGGNDPTGGLIGDALNNSEISECAVRGLSMNMGSVQQVGGLVGALVNNSSVKNSYVIGTISGTSGYKGGITGNSKTSGGGDNTGIIENSYAKVNLGDNTDISGGIATTYPGRFKFKNVVSLSTGYRATPMSNHPERNTIDNGYYVPLANREFEKQTGLEEVAAENINAAFFQDQVKFDNTIWRLDGNVSYDNPPRLQFERTASKGIVSASDYDASRDIIYDNIAKLAPFYSSAKVVELGNKISKTRSITSITSKTIQHLTPLDSNGNLVTYITTKDLDKIARLKIVYDDGTVETYSVMFDKVYDVVASYRIKELQLDYNFPHYVLNADARTIDNLTYYLRNMSYNNGLDPLTKSDDSRIYRDFYNDVTSGELRDFVLKYLANSNYAVTTNIDGLNAQIEREVKENHRLEKELYVYNYLRRFYDLEIKGMKLYDYVLYNMQGYSESATAQQIVDRFFANEAAFNTATTNGDGYIRVYKDLTKMDDLSIFLEHLVKSYGEGMTASQWAASQFKGRLEEVKVDDTDLAYTLWDHFSMSDKYYGKQMLNFILPILTLPKDSSYIFSMPTHIIIGSQRTYLADPNNSDSVKAFDIRVSAYAARYKTYFTTAWRILQDKDLFNNMHLYQMDKNWAYDDNGQSNKQRSGSTSDPHHKNFNEVIRRFSGDGGINAGSYGNRIEWDVAGVMDSNLKEIVDKTAQEVPNYPTMSWSEATFGTFSHETLHNIDAKVFLRDNGRRWDSGGEDYADGNLRQEFSPSLIVMNLSRDWGANCGYGANCSPSTVDSQQEVWDFYSRAFDTIYAMDYLEGLIFLQLEPEEMAEIAVQATYPNETGDGFTGQLATNFPHGLADDEKAIWRAYHTTKYVKRNADFYRDLKEKGKLETIGDLYDNHIVVYPGVYVDTAYGDNKYGSEGLGNVHWYQPHNLYGRPDSYSLKWLAYEMMGLKGWDGGYIEYYSNKVLPADRVAYTYYTSFADGTKQPFGKDSTLSNDQRLPTKTTPVNDGEAASAYYKTDEMAFSKIIDNYNNFDKSKYKEGFEAYKKQRFDKVAKTINQFTSVVNIKEFVNTLFDALEDDVYRQTVELKDFLGRNHPNMGRAPGTVESCLKDYWCTHGYAPYNWDGLNNYTTKKYSTQARIDFYQKVKNATNDFTSGAIYTNTKTQDFNNEEELIDYIKQLIQEYKSKPETHPEEAIPDPSEGETPPTEPDVEEGGDDFEDELKGKEGEE